MNRARLVELEKMARKLRHHIVDMVGCDGKKTGHLGGSCSSADIVTALYFGVMNISAENRHGLDRDRFILSKGHAALAQYAALAEKGFFPAEELKTVKKLGSRLQGHPDCNKLPGVEANTGSLGQGLSQGLGMALALRNTNAYVYVLIGDGELDEGQIWEAVMCAATYRLDHLVAIVDCNGLCASGSLSHANDPETLVKKWEAFGWNAIMTDGHDLAQLMNAFEQAKGSAGRPQVIIAKTVKGKGVSFAENNFSYHNTLLTPQQFHTAHQDIDAVS